MKSKASIGLGLALILGAFSLGRTAGAQQDEKAKHFSIIVTTTADGATMRCELGCLWTDLSFGCDGKSPCTARVDEHGVGGAGDDEAHVRE